MPSVNPHTASTNLPPAPSLHASHPSYSGNLLKLQFDGSDDDDYNLFNAEDKVVITGTANLGIGTTDPQEA